MPTISRPQSSQASQFARRIRRFWPGGRFETRFTSPPSGAGQFRAGWTVFWAAFLARVLYMTLAQTYQFRLADDHFHFGWEMGRIARALATGYGFANPFRGHTGPTAWEAPLYPLVLAGAFKVFGVYTLLSAWVILAFNSFLSALTALTTYEIAARCFNRRIAFWSAWIWALYPAAMQYATRWVWDMALSTWLFSCILVLALRMRRVGEVQDIAGGAANREREERNRGSLRQWLLFGLLWGLLALSNPSLLLFLPATGLWVLLGAPSPGAYSWTGFVRAIASALVFMAVVSPWTVRNCRVFHAFVPFRSNFGAELSMGNGSGLNGMPWGRTVAGQYQMRRYARLGELRYAREQGTIAREWIRSHPERFAELSLKRFYFFWIGVPHPSGKYWYVEAGRVLNFAFASIAGLLGLALALKRRTPAAWLFLWAFILVPLPYYCVIVLARHRSPLEPSIVILGVFVVQSAERSWAVLPSLFRRKRDTIA